MRRKDRELSRDEALKIIDECEYAVISCVDSKGEIFSLPLSIVRENMSIFIHGATSGGKCENFINGRVCKIVAVSQNAVPKLSSEFFESIKITMLSLVNMPLLLSIKVRLLLALLIC